MAEVYNLETVAQMKAIADPLRMDIVDALARRAMTVTQLGEALGVAPARAHYHVRELERVGLVRLVDTRANGAILEKYYRPIARNIAVPGALLSTAPDESIATIGDYLQRIGREFLQAVSHAMQAPAEHFHGISQSEDRLWMTDEEYRRVEQDIRALLAPYEERRGLEGERRRSIVRVSYPTPAITDDDAEAPRRGGRATQHTRRGHVFGVGVLSFNRADFERYLARDQHLDVNFVGALIIADDVTPDLIDKVVRRFRHRGLLTASAEVRAALKRKEG